jgi:hypothetical protein
MATFRKLHTTYWTDPFVEELTPQQKLFYLYLLGNTKTKQSGIYEISKKYISYEIGFSIKEVTELLSFFEENKKIIYSESTNEIAILNWNKYNYNSSYQTITCIHTDLLEIKNIDLVKKIYTEEYIENLISDIETKEEKHKPKYGPYMEYLCSIYGPSMGHKQQEQEQAQEEEEVKEEVKVEVEVEVEEVIDIKKAEQFDKLFEDFNL